MFVRIEIGQKAEFSDPEANQLISLLREVQTDQRFGAISDRLRWLRKLKVFWIHLNAPRDRVVHAVQVAFKNRVTDWVFTGDLLPSAAGATGTLFDIMQEAPHRPGVFHGIEKRTRLQSHDEEAGVLLDALQTILGRRSSQDRVVSGELMIVEGAKLARDDLEWLAKYWFAHEQQESWSILPEEELKKNSRFQHEQVQKYISNPIERPPSRLLQFRPTQQPAKEISWEEINELIKTPMECDETAMIDEGEEFNLSTEIRFSSKDLQHRTQSEIEGQLVRQQLWHEALQCEPRLQTVLSVLPDSNRLWRGELHGAHPLRIKSEFNRALKRVAETTDTPVVSMKCFESLDESEPSYFWTTTVAVGKPTKGAGAKNANIDKGPAGLFWISHSDLISAKLVQFALDQCLKGEAIEFSVPGSGRSLMEILKRAKAELSYGFDIVVDGVEEWFQKYVNAPLPLGQVWGVKDDKREWVIEELKTRGISFLHFGMTSMTGDIRFLEKGDVRAKASITNFFNIKPYSAKKDLLEEPVFTGETRQQPVHFQNRFSTEELVLKPEFNHVSIASPVVLRPSLMSWSGVMVLGDLCGTDFDASRLEYLFRKCTAIGGVIHSMQVSFLNGLKTWYKTFEKAQAQYGVKLDQAESIVDPEIRSHWLAMQLISRVNDIRSIRSEDFKHPHDRIYWLPGGFDQPASRLVARWLACVEGRYQNSLHSAVAIESTDGRQGVINTLTYTLVKRRLGAELKLQHHFPGGFFVSMSENERFAVEEEWRTMGIEFEFVGRTTSSPFLVVRDESDRAQTISIEDLA
ncbi:MAG: hypothetical protein JST80_11770 [Bdellovibrionales bacterium]|nr:hypothetical protein [Bdellovibrionales bacterium]